MTNITQKAESISLDGNGAIGPYSDAVRVGDMLFLSGRIGLDQSTMQLVSGGIEEQTRQCLANITQVLQLAGNSLENVIKSTVFLSDMSDFAAMNLVYAEFFPDWKPARSTVAVAGLPMGALVEIETIAVF